jgi:transcription elongation GreA/GreB family factor
VNRVIDCLEQDLGGDHLKAQKLLRTVFEQDWLEIVMQALSPRQREAVMTRIINGARGWDPAGRRSLMAKLIRHFPELQHVTATSARDGVPQSRLHFTSWRTYRERQEQFRKLVEEAIPENSREIAVARSYGDLSENFEYHAAKHQQGLLLRRKGEMETELATVRGTDFSGVSTDVAGMGTIVALRRPDGREQRFCILGEWDRDEALNIISNQSKLALLLDGLAAGGEAALPGEHGEELCHILSVSPLSDEIRAWIGSSV